MKNMEFINTILTQFADIPIDADLEGNVGEFDTVSYEDDWDTIIDMIADFN